MLKTDARIYPVDEKPVRGEFTSIPNIWLYGSIAKGLKKSNIVEESSSASGVSLISYMKNLRPLELYDVHVTVVRNNTPIDAMAFLWRGEFDNTVRAIITDAKDTSAIKFAHKKQEEYARSL